MANTLTVSRRKKPALISCTSTRQLNSYDIPDEMYEREPGYVFSSKSNTMRLRGDKRK
jgi:hypothetical protein